MSDSERNIGALAGLFIELSGAIAEGERLVKEMRAKSRESLNGELAPYLAQIETWKQAKAEAADVLLPEYIRVAEAHGLKRWGGLELRRGKTYRALLPEEGSPEYRAIACALHDSGAVVDYEPVVELKIRVNRLNQWLKEGGLAEAAALGIELAATDTLVAVKDKEEA